MRTARVKLGGKKQQLRSKYTQDTLIILTQMLEEPSVIMCTIGQDTRTQ